jgi:hypothetical protein
MQFLKCRPDVRTKLPDLGARSKGPELFSLTATTREGLLAGDLDYNAVLWRGAPGHTHPHLGDRTRPQ